MDQKRLFRLLSRVFLFQNILSWWKTRVPPVLEHNLAKYDAIKKSFYLTALDHTGGDYLEFGVFTGSSFVCAIRSYKAMRGLFDAPITFCGYDSFKGFGDVKKGDQHQFYLDSIFNVNAKKVIRNIERKAGNLKTKIIQGYYEKTLRKPCSAHGIRKARIVFIDCDMKSPSLLALDYVKGALQQGTIILIDDFYSYRGDSTKGCAGAFFEFLRKYKTMRVRELFPYGYGGIAFIVERTPK